MADKDRRVTEPSNEIFSNQVHTLIMSVWGDPNVSPQHVASTLLMGALWVTAAVLGSNQKALDWLKLQADREPPPDELRASLH